MSIHGRLIKFLEEQHVDAKLPDTQIVLIGSNTLPCYVAIYVLKPKKVWLICSPETYNRAVNLKQLLIEQFPDLKKDDVQIREVQNAYDEQEICDVIQNLKEIDKVNLKETGLHYTGGTKRMAVYAYQAWKKENPKKHYATYLDPRTVELKFDGLQDGFDLSFEPQISIDTLLKLHGVQKKDPEKGKVNEKRLEWAKAILKDIQNEESEKIKTELFPYCKNLKQKYQLINHNNNINLRAFKDKSTYVDFSLEINFDNLTISYQPKTKLMKLNKLELSDFWSHLKDTLSESNTNSINFEEIIKIIAPTLTSKKDKQKMKEVTYKWLEGAWLEDYVVSILLDIAKEYNINSDSIHSSFEIERIIKKDEKEKEFEMDVVFIRGHIPYVISCTTDNKQYCKPKLFEVQSRAALLGGDHARFGLVCFADEKLTQSLKSELHKNWDEVVRYEVFGLEDLKYPEHFKKKLKDWIIPNT